MHPLNKSAIELRDFLKSAQFTTSHSIIVFSGAGMSAESGISTFRDEGGLWEKHSIEEVATPDAWRRDKEKVLHFYNLRRKQLLEVEPNEGHQLIAKLEEDYNVKVVTQNIDDLHERAGSNKVLHLHGELRKARSTINPQDLYDIEGWELKLGDRCARGSQLRPHVVWFGEAVPALDEAINWLEGCGLMLVIGSSLQVYPAASLVQMVDPNCPVVLIDPEPMAVQGTSPYFQIQLGASEGMRLISSVLNSFNEGI